MTRRPTVSEPRTAAVLRMDRIIEHVESWPPSGDDFLDDLRYIRSVLAEAAQPIDVERLAKALEATHLMEDDDDCLYIADATAAEYARLSGVCEYCRIGRHAAQPMSGWDVCLTCGCELTYPLEVQPDCRYPDCENCHESETAHRAADGDR